MYVSCSCSTFVSPISDTLVNIVILGIKVEATAAVVVSHKPDVCKYPVCRGVELGKVLAKEVRVRLSHYYSHLIFLCSITRVPASDGLIEY